MIKTIEKGISELAKTRGEKSLLNFTKIYLAHHIKSYPESQAHRAIYTLLDEALVKRGQFMVFAAPRGFGKSTLITLAYVLYVICYGKEKNIMVISETEKSAQDFLEHIKYELLNNQKIAEDFSEVFENLKPRPERWNEREIRTKNRIRVMRLGVRQQLRGTKYNNTRPTLVILDDIESADSTRSPEMREKQREWLTKDVLNIGFERTNMIMVGTIHHPESLMAEYTSQLKHAEWTKRIYRAVIQYADRADLWDTFTNIYCFRQEYEEQTGKEGAMKFYQDNEAAMLEGVVTLWPERWQYVDLIIKKIESHSAFQSEQQNDPVDPRTQIFDIENFSYWDKEYPSVEALLIGLGKELRIFASCDPSIGKNPDRGDYSAIIVVAWHQLSKAAYLLEADIKRRKSNETVKAILDLHRRYYFEQIAVEANSGQEYLIQNLESTARDSKTPIRIFPVTNTKNKNSRIESLQSYTALGMIKFCRKHKLLLEQLQEFPKGKHDDGPDALQMAMELTFARMNNAIDLSVWVNAEEPKRSRSSSLLASLGWR